MYTLNFSLCQTSKLQIFDENEQEKAKNTFTATKKPLKSATVSNKNSTFARLFTFNN